MKKVGCQSFWNKYDMKGIDICKNEKMKLYTAERGRLGMMYREELIAVTNCLMPCTYMEYDVSQSCNN